MKFILIIFLSFLMFGCDDIKHLSESDVVYEIESIGTNTSDINILVARMSEYQSSLFSKVEYVRDKNEIVFSKGAPDENIVKYMSTRHGKFSIGGENEFNTWISNKHISNVAVSIQNEQVFLDLALNDEGAKIMAAKTRVNIGKKIVAKLDGKILMRAIITQKLGQYFRISTGSESPAEMLKISTLLKYGNINNPIVLRPKS